MTKVEILVIAVSLATACIHYETWPASPEEILSQMRTDTAWICELDSLAGIAIGPGARCIDPVKHTFAYDGRTWFFNEDWGGVLEIPSDYLPEDDLNQVELSFHGTRAISPDSLVSVSFYAGFLPMDVEALCSPQIVQGRSAEGTNYWARHVYSEADNVLYSVCVCYPDGREVEAVRVIVLADSYPVGPCGVLFRGLCLQDLTSVARLFGGRGNRL